MVLGFQGASLYHSRPLLVIASYKEGLEVGYACTGVGNILR